MCLHIDVNINLGKGLRKSAMRTKIFIYQKIKKKSYIGGITKPINAITDLLIKMEVLMTLVNLISLSSRIFKILEI